VRFAEGAGFSDTRRRAAERGVRVLAESHTVAPNPHLDGALGKDEMFTAVCQLHNGTGRAINHMLCEKGGAGKAAARDMWPAHHTTAYVRQGSECTVSQGVEQGGTLSPIPFSVYG
jgi:hypothetical protein